MKGKWFFAMYSIKLRYIRLWLARRIGHFYRWLFSEWRLPLFWLAVAALVVRVGEFWLSHKPGQSPWETVRWWTQYLRDADRSWLEALRETAIWWARSLSQSFWDDAAWWGTYWWSILSVYALFVFLWWAWQTRKRVVVEEFVDHTSEPSAKGTDKQPGSSAKGLGTLLVVELARLRDLYRVVDDQRANPMAVGNKRTVPATFTTEDDSGFLKSAVSTESKFSIGPLTIPVGTFLSLVGRLVQGPRLAGSLHRDGDRLTLTAQMIGQGRSYSWRVDGAAPVTQPADNEHPGLDGMVAELACRMFTDLAERGSDRWKAVRAFCKGLRAYRDCLHTRKDQQPDLRVAERNFAKAWEEDDDFDLVYYNLGLVHLELKEYEAAKVDFSKSIARNPERWEVFYALGRVRHYKDGEYESAARLCEHIISFKPTRAGIKPPRADIAKAYNLKGLAELNLYWKRLAESDPRSSKPPIESLTPDAKKRASQRLKRATKSCSQAVAWSWAALCVAERGWGGVGSEQGVVPQPIALASSCLRNLAVAYREAADNSTGAGQISLYRRAEALLRQALRLTNFETETYCELGRTYLRMTYIYLKQGKHKPAARKVERAIRELETVTIINPAADTTSRDDLASAYACRSDIAKKLAVHERNKALEVAKKSIRKTWTT